MHFLLLENECFPASFLVSFESNTLARLVNCLPLLLEDLNLFAHFVFVFSPLIDFFCYDFLFELTDHHRAQIFVIILISKVFQSSIFLHRCRRQTLKVLLCIIVLDNATRWFWGCWLFWQHNATTLTGRHCWLRHQIIGRLHFESLWTYSRVFVQPPILPRCTLLRCQIGFRMRFAGGLNSFAVIVQLSLELLLLFSLCHFFIDDVLELSGILLFDLLERGSVISFDLGVWYHTLLPNLIDFHLQGLSVLLNRYLWNWFCQKRIFHWSHRSPYGLRQCKLVRI